MKCKQLDTNDKYKIGDVVINYEKKQWIMIMMKNKVCYMDINNELICFKPMIYTRGKKAISDSTIKSFRKSQKDK